MFLTGAALAAMEGIITWVLIHDMDLDLESECARYQAYLLSNGYSADYGEF